jgi:hypothetical protein
MNTVVPLAAVSCHTPVGFHLLRLFISGVAERRGASRCHLLSHIKLHTRGLAIQLSCQLHSRVKFSFLDGGPVLVCIKCSEEGSQSLDTGDVLTFYV